MSSAPEEAGEDSEEEYSRDIGRYYGALGAYEDTKEKEYQDAKEKSGSKHEHDRAEVEVKECKIAVESKHKSSACEEDDEDSEEEYARAIGEYYRGLRAYQDGKQNSGSKHEHDPAKVKPKECKRAVESKQDNCASKVKRSAKTTVQKSLANLRD